MAAVPAKGTMVAIGQASGRTYSIDIYLDDIDDANVNFDSGTGASATSDTYYVFPEGVTITDLILESATEDCDRIRIVANGTPTSMVLRHKVNFLASVQQRPRIAIGVNPGTRFIFVQVAT